VRNVEQFTHKQTIFIELYNRGMNGTIAAKMAYNTKNDNTAAVIASQNLRKLKVSNEIYVHNIFNGFIRKSIKTISEGLDATKYNRFTNKYEPNHIIRLRASKQAIKLLDEFTSRYR
jgi:hypothetical protein